MKTQIQKYDKGVTKLSAGCADFKRFLKEGLTDKEIAAKYTPTELVALLRYNWNRITDDRK